MKGEKKGNILLIIIPVVFCVIIGVIALSCGLIIQRIGGCGDQNWFLYRIKCEINNKIE